VKIYLTLALDTELNFESLGCWKDVASERAIVPLEGKDEILDGHYLKREDAITKCYTAALKLGYRVFALQHGGFCMSSPEAEETYHMYGQAKNCREDGEGGPGTSQVYRIKRKHNMAPTALVCKKTFLIGNV